MKISELIDLCQRHLVRYGDGDVVAETRDEVLDVAKGEADKFELDAEHWSLVLALDMDSGDQ